LNAEKRLTPSFEVDRVHPIDERPLRRTWTALRLTGRAQQVSPAFLDQPTDSCVGKGIAQSMGCWQRVDNISHRAEAHDEQALDFRGTGCGCNQDFLDDKRD
jgi:hypothetical protein